MRLISSAEIDLYPGSQQERLPGFSPQFPHICSHVLLPDGPAGGCIWHWHKSMELFYVIRVPSSTICPADSGCSGPAVAAW